MSTEFKLIDAVKAGDKAECTRLLELEDIDIDIHEREEDGRSSIYNMGIKERQCEYSRAVTI